MSCVFIVYTFSVVLHRVVCIIYSNAILYHSML